jgi:hypothetical protein
MRCEAVMIGGIRGQRGSFEGQKFFLVQITRQNETKVILLQSG